MTLVVSWVDTTNSNTSNTMNRFLNRFTACVPTRFCSEEPLCHKQHSAFHSNDRKYPVQGSRHIITEVLKQTSHLLYVHLSSICDSSHRRKYLTWKRQCETEKETFKIKTYFQKGLCLIMFRIWIFFYHRPLNMVCLARSVKVSTSRGKFQKAQGTLRGIRF